MFDFKETTFRYLCIFNCNKSILVRLWETCLYHKDGCSQKLKYKSYYEEKAKQRGVKDMEFSGVLAK